MNELEMLLLEMWAESGIKEIYKYKNRIKIFVREGLSRSDLFYDLTNGVIFTDVQDTADRDDMYAEDYKVSVNQLIEARTGGSQ